MDATNRETDPETIKRIQQPHTEVLRGDGPNEHQSPVVRAFADVFHRAREATSSTWSERFVQHHRDLFAGQQWETHNCVYSHVPDLETYRTKRRESIGADLIYDLITLSEGWDPLPEFYQARSYQDLLSVAGNICAWTNDVYSLRKELAENEVNNIVLVVRNEQDCSFQNAVTKACAMIDAETQRFEDTRQQVLDEFDGLEGLQTHLTHIEEVIGGNLAISKASVRYEVSDDGSISD